MVEVVAVGLNSDSQGRVLAVPLPSMGSAAALALVLLQICACSPQCWWGGLCGGVPCSPPCQTPAVSASWCNTQVWKPSEDLPPALYCSLGLYLPSHGQDSISSLCRLRPRLHHRQGWAGSWHERRRDRLQPPLSLHAAEGLIDKQVSAPKEKRRSRFEAASLINTQPWLSPPPTGFQTTAARVIRALGSTVSAIITG